MLSQEAVEHALLIMDERTARRAEFDGVDASTLPTPDRAQQRLAAAVTAVIMGKLTSMLAVLVISGFSSERLLGVTELTLDWIDAEHGTIPGYLLRSP